MAGKTKWMATGFFCAGFVIEGAVYMTVADAGCIRRARSRFVSAVATQKDGLLPASQKALPASP